MKTEGCDKKTRPGNLRGRERCNRTSRYPALRIPRGNNEDYYTIYLDKVDLMRR